MTPEQRILQYLYGKKASVELMTMSQAINFVKNDVFYGMPPLGDEAIRKIIANWAMWNAPGLLTKVANTGGASDPDDPSKPPAVVTDSEFMDAVKKAIKTVSAGVKIGNDKQNVTIQVIGASAKLLDGVITAELSWTGTLEVGVNSGPLHFTGTLGSDEWQIEVSFPNKTSLPNAATLGKVFGEGESALRKLARQRHNIKSLDDAKRITALMKPEIAAVQEAADAVMRLEKNARSSKGGFDVGFKIGSPPPGPNQDGIPKGYEGSIVFTYRW
ncbi:MAG: hypothetical protein JST65_19240 [Acidobacteria bacterium]|nr:hypothetical protein [Acidobacteriota bacterium]